MALVSLICLVSGCGSRSPLDRVLEGGAGPVDADAPEEFTSTDSGLRYRVLRKGTGESPLPRDTVTVRFAGWLDSGRQFDSTYHQIEPLEIYLPSSIPAMREGLQHVSEGGMIVLDVPAKLGYGPAGHSDVVPPNSDLNFLVELIGVQHALARVEPGQADPDAPKEFTVTESGLRHRILRPGNDQKPTLEDQVSVHYRGSLMDGRVFDSSYFRGEPLTVTVKNVIDGWGEGLTLIGEGGMIELVIPSKLGYGEEGYPPRVPANADLHFLVELQEILSE